MQGFFVRQSITMVPSWCLDCESSHTLQGGFSSGLGLQPYSPKRHNRWDQTRCGPNRGLMGIIKEETRKRQGPTLPCLGNRAYVVQPELEKEAQASVAGATNLE